MSWLSKVLSGVTFNPEEFGIHVDSAGNVVDEKLCLENFEVCAKRLAAM